MVQGRDTAATVVGATPTDTTATAPGSALYWGVQRYFNDVSQRMDNVENSIANNTRGRAAATALIDVHPLLDSLEALKTKTDAAGNVYPDVAPAISSMIDDEIANINRARTPEDPELQSSFKPDQAPPTRL